MRGADGVAPAALVGDDAAVLREQAHGAVRAHRRRRRHDAFLVHRETHQCRVAALGDDLADVAHVAAGAHFHEQAAQVRIVRSLQVHDVVRRGEDGLAIRRLDVAGVVDLRREDQDAPAARGAELRAGLDFDGAHVGAALQRRLALVDRARDADAVEGFVGHVQRRRDQRAHVHLRALAEHDAVGIDQVDLPVRRHRAEDLARALLVDAVQRDRAGRRLREADRMILGHVEAGPVQDRAIALLLDVEMVAGDRRSGRAGGDPHTRTAGAAGAAHARDRQIRGARRRGRQQQAESREQRRAALERRTHGVAQGIAQLPPPLHRPYCTEKSMR